MEYGSFKKNWEIIVVKTSIFSELKKMISRYSIALATDITIVLFWIIMIGLLMVKVAYIPEFDILLTLIFVALEVVNIWRLIIFVDRLISLKPKVE